MPEPQKIALAASPSARASIALHDEGVASESISGGMGDAASHRSLDPAFLIRRKNSQY
ncbi:hypothetical protein [Methanocalculus taiwanensis]|uniref:hypothetical protein n=1 Tax=Methanocalculus taiwanensis TaxID=106207 RepID=UPI002100825B|nr:hypothetical protein [Methanocalculus taiwanensis]